MSFCLKVMHDQHTLCKPVNVPNLEDSADSYVETVIGNINTDKCHINLLHFECLQLSKVHFVIGCLSMASSKCGTREFTIRNLSLDTLKCCDDDMGKITEIESGWVYPLRSNTTIFIGSQQLPAHFVFISASDSKISSSCSLSRFDTPYSHAKAETVAMFGKRKYDYSDGTGELQKAPLNEKADIVTTSHKTSPPAVGEHSQFKVGDKVELCDINPGYRGAWFPATIVTAERDRFECEYCHFVVDSSTKKLREWKRMKFTTFKTDFAQGKLVQRSVSMWGIRPSPPYHKVKPPLPAECWPIGSIVEAKVTDAWWKGKVTRILKRGICVEVHFDKPPQGEGGKEIIKLQDTRKALYWDDMAPSEEKPKDGKHYGRWWECT